MSGQRANLTWLRSSTPPPERLAKTGSRDSLRSGNPTRVLPHEEKMATKMSKRIGPDGIIYFVVLMYPLYVGSLCMYIPTTWLGACMIWLRFATPVRTPSVSRLILGTRLIMRSDISPLLTIYEKVKVCPPID